MADYQNDLRHLLTATQKFLSQQEELYGGLIYRHVKNEAPQPQPSQQQSPAPSKTPQSPQTGEQVPAVQEDLFGLSTPMRLSSSSRASSNVLPYPNEPWVSADSLETLNSLICTCTKCSLGHTRKNFVFGVGNPQAKLVLVGEAPGADEDEQGEPFVGRAGQLLNKILEAIHFRRQEVYICNILKCRPPNNRDPQPDEIELCEPYLWKQLEIIKPKLILCLGRIAAQALLKTNASLSQLRGKIHDYRGIKLMVTYHPAALLRNPNWKRPTWEDVQLVRKVYDELMREAASG